MDSGNDSATSQGFSMTNEQRGNLNAKQRALAKDLIVPRRPEWNEGMSKFQLDRQEKEAF